MRNHLRLWWQLAFDRPGLFRRLQGLDWYAAMLDDWVRELTLAPGQALAEIGCGPGDFSARLAGRGLRVTGFDPSAPMLARAASLSHPHLSFQQAGLPQLPTENCSYQTVIAASVINVIPQPQDGLREMLRICRPRGQVSVLFPLIDFDHRRSPVDDASRPILKLWEKRARKLSLEQVEGWFRQTGLCQITSRTLLGGNVGVVTGRA